MYLSIWKLKKTRHEMKPSKDLRMEVSDNKVRDEGLVFESKKVAFFVGAVFWVFFFVAKELILFYCHTHTHCNLCLCFTASIHDDMACALNFVV
jgi:hypothetical protein